MKGAAPPASAVERRLGSSERLALAALLAVLVHAVLYVLLALAVRIEWPHPRSYLGSVTVELETDSSPAVPAPRAPVATPVPATPRPTPAPAVTAARTPAAAPSTTLRSATVQPKSAAESVTRPAPTSAPTTAPRAAVASSTPAPAPAAATPAASRVAPAVAAAPAPRATAETRTPAGAPEDAFPSAGVERPAASVPGAPIGAQAEAQAAPIEEVPSDFVLPPRASESRTRSTETTAETRLAGSPRGAVGGAVTEERSGPDYVAEVTGRAGSPGAVGSPVSGAAGGSIAGLQVGVLPLADAERGYTVRAEELTKGNRGLVGYVEPDLRGLEVTSRTQVEFTFHVAASGLVMDPRPSRGSPSAEIDRALRVALSHWQFSPAPDGTPMVPASVTFTLVPRPRS